MRIVWLGASTGKLSSPGYVAKLPTFHSGYRKGKNMPVVVTLRDGDFVEFEDATDYGISDIGMLTVMGEVSASFQPPAWSYVIKEPPAKPAPETVYGGQLVKAGPNDVTYNIQVGDTEKAFKEAQRRANIGKRQ